MTECPVCGSELTFPGSVETGEIVDCGACAAELEIIDLDPLTVDRAPEFQEDWGE